jgi:hypothetical protein
MKIDRTKFAALLVLCLTATLCSLAAAQTKSAAKGNLTGSYQGTAKDKEQNIIDVTFDLTDKDGALTGMIHSSHGDFTITAGSHKGDNVTLEFDANGGTGTITLQMSADKMSGNWSAGEDGGSVDVKKVAAADAAKGKS